MSYTFSSAVHIGLTATPKREDNVDTYDYFGKPVYEYSLKEGIYDGFLTPYKVKRVRTNLDEYIFKSGDNVKQAGAPVGDDENASKELRELDGRRFDHQGRLRLFEEELHPADQGEDLAAPDELGNP